MTRSSPDIVERLRAACDGHPAAKIAWPHRVLHEAADEIERLRHDIERHVDIANAYINDVAATPAGCGTPGCTDPNCEYGKDEDESYERGFKAGYEVAVSAAPTPTNRDLHDAIATAVTKRTYSGIQDAVREIQKLYGVPAQGPADPFNRKQVEAVCRAVCVVEGVDPDDTEWTGDDPPWTRYADAVAEALAHPSTPRGTLTAERCLTCDRTDKEYRDSSRSCVDPWHGDDHLRAKARSLTSPQGDSK